jgi:hypothetical protein
MDADELVRTEADVESTAAAAMETYVNDAAHMEAVVDLVVEMASEEVREVVAEAGSLEAVSLGARRAVVERVIDRAVVAASAAR